MKTNKILAAVLAATAVGASAAYRPDAPACTLGGVKVPTFKQESVPTAEWSRLHAALRPSGAAERWTEIPWQTDLAAARKAAAEQDKPLLMWIMDGHPLGCT
jgi:hypothetical protein